MSQDEQQPGGLLSKVVKFVRNPTMNWADLDQPEDKESHYSKQMLKEMIERKRANDFVRRREFDQLRKLRQRGPHGGAGDVDAAGQPSFFQSSLQSHSGDRAGTLKKIDEIEAQMSQQWWKSRGEKRPAAVGGSPIESPSIAPEQAHQYATTVHASLEQSLAPVSDFAATDISPMEGALIGELDSADMPAGLDEGLALDTPELAAPGGLAEVFHHDPALEEAALRFANGDDAGAEAALQALLAPDAPTPAHEGIWMGLFDLYRASGQRGGFDTLAIDFAMRMHRSAPLWFSLADTPAQRSGVVSFQAATWSCPGVLGAVQVRALQDLVVDRHPDVLELDWSLLMVIEDDALEPLGALLAGWALQSFQLHCTGAARLDALLRRRTVSVDRGVLRAWWQLRLQWLRITQRPDEFDLVALDYCVTYEVSPPAWEGALCGFVALDAPADVPRRADAAVSARPSGAGPASSPAAGVLSGIVLGDAIEALAPLEARAPANGVLVIDCERLVRVDFAAAGSVLNWAAAQEAAGRRVQFRGLHRLVAVFLNVIGVGDHASLVLRRN